MSTRLAWQQEINKFYLENWFLSLPRWQLLPTRPRLVYYPEIYRIVIITVIVKEANLEFFCSYDQGCLDDDGERNGGAIQETRLSSAKHPHVLIERMTIIWRSDEFKGKKGMRSRSGCARQYCVIHHLRL